MMWAWASARSRQELGPPADDLDAVADEAFHHLLEVERAGTVVHECDHDDGEAGLERGVLVELG